MAKSTQPDLYAEQGFPMPAETPEERVVSDIGSEVTVDKLAELAGARVDAIVEPPPAAESNRKILNLQERLDVIDYLRGLQAPIYGRTKVEIARKVAEATGIDYLNPQSLYYIVEQTPKAKLDEKLVLIEETTPEGILTLAVEKIGLLDGRLAEIELQASKRLDGLDETIAALDEGAARITDELGKVEARFNTKLTALMEQFAKMEDKLQSLGYAGGVVQRVAELFNRLETLERSSIKA